MPYSGMEQRQHPRYPVHDLGVLCAIPYSTDAKLLNISVGGAYVSMDRRVRIGGVYSLQLHCFDGSVILLRARVARTSLSEIGKPAGGESPPRYEAGFEFQNVLTGPGSDLLIFLESKMDEGRQGGRLRGSRVRTGGAQAAPNVEIYEECPVVILGMGGLGMDTVQTFETGAPIHLDLRLSDANPGFPIQGRIADSKRVEGISPVKFRTGVAFVEIRPADRKKLAVFVAAHSQKVRARISEAE